MSEKKNEQFENANFVETMIKDIRDYKPIERDSFPFWNTGEVQSFMPDLESGCIFSPEYAEIQRRDRRQSDSSGEAVERDSYHTWNMEAVQSFLPDLESGCIFSPEYAEIQRKLRGNGKK